MTAIEALEKTERMWRWISQHPGAYKSDVPGDRRPADAPYCFLCDFVRQETPYTCTVCPMLGHWSENHTNHCRSSDSVYYRWEISQIRGLLEEAALYAGEVADRCHDRRLELEKEE